MVCKPSFTKCIKREKILIFWFAKGKWICKSVLVYCEMQFWIFVWDVCFFQMWLFQQVVNHEASLIKKELALVLLPHLAICSFPFCSLFHRRGWVHCPTDQGTSWAGSFYPFSFWLSSLPSSFFFFPIETFLLLSFLTTSLHFFVVNLNKLKNFKSSRHTQVCGLSCVHITYL